MLRRRTKAVALLLLLFSVVMRAQQVTMMVLSDPHVMDTSLFDVPYGEAFMQAMQRDLKVNESSAQLFDKFVGIVLKERPQLLLVPGDLTKDGEKASHM